MTEFCIERILPLNLQDVAMRKAIAENPANAPPPDLSGMEAAVETRKLWRPGRTLRIAFLNGHSEVQEEVKRHARVWTRHANIKFDFVEGADGEIRIAFNSPRSWSAVGTDALVERFFPAGEPTMNFGWLQPDSSESAYSAVVLHEFGHALGMIHEHQNPVNEIRWNKEVVYRELAGPPNNWNKADVDRNLFNKYSVTQTQFTDFDPESIMLYSFPSHWNLDDLSFQRNSVLSQSDKDFIRKMYPG